MFRLAPFTDQEPKNCKQESRRRLPGMPQRWRGKARTASTAVSSRKWPRWFTLAGPEERRDPGRCAPLLQTPARATLLHAVGPCCGPLGALCPGSLSKKPNNAGCSWQGQAWLTQFRVLGEVLWGNRTGSISTMTTSALVSAVQKQNPKKKCYHTKLYGAFVL